jgi:Fungal specific transcription factor domain
MFHRPTFLNALATAQIPKYLLISVFALAAPFSLHPSLRKPSTSGAGPIPHWQTGDRFAQRAVAELRSYGPPDACGRISAANRPGEELEFSQTLCILALHECAMRRPGHIHLKYMSVALKTLVELGVPDWDVSDEIPPTSEATALAPGHSANMAHPDANGMWRRRECHRRTLWVIHWTNMLASAFSLTSIRFRELDVRLYLPMDEGAFDMIMKDDVVPEFLALKSDGPRAHTYISEFGHLLRVTLIYSQIMSIFSERSEASRRRSGSNGEIHEPFDAFQTWDAALEVTSLSLLLCLVQLNHLTSQSLVHIPLTEMASLTP